MDCGASSLIPMKRAGLSTAAIDLILISHLHGDHFGGIPFFILDAQLISRREAPLVIAGPPGLERRVRETMEILYPGSSGIERKFRIEYAELAEGETASLGQLSVLPLRVIHGSGDPPYALRIECAVASPCASRTASPGTGARCGAPAAMRLPRTRTSAANGALPVPS